MAFRRGYPAELELVELLRKLGSYAVRVPVSGGRGFHCDVLLVGFFQLLHGCRFSENELGSVDFGKEPGGDIGERGHSCE